jgi:hypothetical protein
MKFYIHHFYSISLFYKLFHKTTNRIYNLHNNIGSIKCSYDDNEIELIFNPEINDNDDGYHLLDFLTCLEQINASQEGNTQKQKNPHPLKTLPWASWIIARLGGWKGFASQRPPGVIILRLGLERFETLFLGWKLKQDKDVYNR